MLPLFLPSVFPATMKWNGRLMQVCDPNTKQRFFGVGIATAFWLPALHISRVPRGPWCSGNCPMSIANRPIERSQEFTAVARGTVAASAAETSQEARVLSLSSVGQEYAEARHRGCLETS